jgi:hypothetical protein
MVWYETILENHVRFWTSRDTEQEENIQIFTMCNDAPMMVDIQLKQSRRALF